MLVAPTHPLGSWLHKPHPKLSGHILSSGACSWQEDDQPRYSENNEWKIEELLTTSNRMLTVCWSNLILQTVVNYPRQTFSRMTPLIKTKPQEPLCQTREKPLQQHKATSLSAEGNPMPLSQPEYQRQLKGSGVGDGQASQAIICTLFMAWSLFSGHTSQQINCMVRLERHTITIQQLVFCHITQRSSGMFSRQKSKLHLPFHGNSR